MAPSIPGTPDVFIQERLAMKLFDCVGAHLADTLTLFKGDCTYIYLEIIHATNLLGTCVRHAHEMSTAR
eukprot:11176762-Lingulodinium_polyedra.AAC.1